MTPTNSQLSFNDIQSLIQSMDTISLDQLIKESQSELKNRQEAKTKQMLSEYGKIFCDIIGVDTIYSIPVVEAKTLGLLKESKYPQKVVKPSMMGGHSVVRGKTELNRPFIAIKIEMLTPETRKVEAVVVELIFKRYSIDCDGRGGGLHEDNYVTALNNSTNNGEVYPSTLYSTGGMSDSQIQAVKDLLEGKEIKSPVGNYLIRKV
jgi:hypothetical protein